MPLYSYRAYGPQGEFAEGQLEAASEDRVSEILWGQKLVPFEVTSADTSATPWWKREVHFSPDAFSLPQLANFTREFATLMAAGIPLIDALRILVDQAPSAVARSVLELMLKDVLGGAALSEAMQKHPKGFSGEYVSVIKAAEVGGAHGEALEELAQLLERRAELRARLHSALIYPAILILLSLVSLGIITGVLIPNIAPIFNETGKEAPGTVVFLMTLHDDWPAILAAIAGLAVATFAGLTLSLRKPPIRLAFDRWKQRAPMIGPFLLKQETARFARTFGTLIKSGVPLLQAGHSARAIVKNQALAASIDQALARVREGASLHSALKEETPLPPLAIRMISVGEEAASLGQMLVRVAAIFEREAQRSLDRAMTVLTPAITLFIAVLIGLLIVTIMNAVLSLNDIAIG